MTRSLAIAAILSAFLVVAAYIAIRMYAAGASNARVPRVGQTAPEFTLPNQENEPVSLEQYRGKWVVLYFYPKDRTSVCTVEAHRFQRDLEKYAALNAVVLGVSVDSVSSHRKFCTQDSLTFNLLADPGMKVVREYGSLGHFAFWTMAKRNTFLIDPAGKIAKVWLRVQAEGHSEQVLGEIGEFEGLGIRD